MTTTYIPSDPLFPVQWHLLNQGNTPYSRPGYDINVVSVWPDYTGQGVRVGVMDQGMDETHPDLIQNYRGDLSWDLNRDIPGGALWKDDDDHGVSVAGLVAAAADNGVGGVGVAWDAEIVSYRSEFEYLPTATLLLEFSRASERMIADGVDVAVNSWSASAFPFMVQHRQADYHARGREMAESGREGLGIITLFAAGNERIERLDTNDNPVTNMPWGISVAASDQRGGITVYSNPGSSNLVAAPGSFPSTMVTTDRQGEAGYNTESGEAGDYTDRGGSFFDGTSAATPVAAGVVALMLEANPGLGYRDVQEILVYSSKRATFLNRDVDMAFNGARDWNGGALLASHDFGFGHIDAHAAVRLAESWMKTSTVSNLVREPAHISVASLMLEPGQEVEATASFAADYRLEQMLVTVNIEGERLQHLVMELVSPAGTVSRLVNRPPTPEEVIGGDSDDDDDDEADEEFIEGRLVDYDLNTVLNWGESLQGEWTLRLRNDAEGDVLYLQDWSLVAYASGHAGRNAQIFTDEFSAFAELQPERSQIDPAEGAILNAAAVTQDVIFDLSTGTSWIGDQSLVLLEPEDFRHVVTGDGNDVLIGNDADNLFMAGRGNNHVDGGAGLDGMRLIGESSAYLVELEQEAIVIHSQELADGGVDVLRNIDLLLFDDQVMLTRAPTNLGPDLFDETVYLAQYPDVAAWVEWGLLASGYEHYLYLGRAEGRNPNALFNESWYLATNEDIAQGVEAGVLTSGYQHYLEHGWAEGRLPSPWMDTDAYLADNPDIAEAGINPLEHYLHHGLHEGRVITALDTEFWI